MNNRPRSKEQIRVDKELNQKVEDFIIEVLKEQNDITITSLEKDQQMKDLGMDSLDIAYFENEIEKEYNISFREGDITEKDNLKRIVKVTLEKIKEQVK